MKYYIASCAFTVQNPELSMKIQRYIAKKPDFRIVRCCVPHWKEREYEQRMPAGEAQDTWCALPQTADFQPGDEVYSLCHSCTNIIDERRPGVIARSLWELIDADSAFPFPNCADLRATIQDCWRSRDRADEQAAVRSILKKMHISFIEAERNHADTDFCGASLYRPQVERNPRLAPKHYREGCEHLFQPHTPEEQARIMREHCARYTTPAVICYCHSCLEGLKMGGANAMHLAELLFKSEEKA